MIERLKQTLIINPDGITRCGNCGYSDHVSTLEHCPGCQTNFQFVTTEDAQSRGFVLYLRPDLLFIEPDGSDARLTTKDYLASKEWQEGDEDQT